MNKMIKIACPECESDIEISGNVNLGRIVECITCGTESEIVSISPLKLSPIEEEK